MPGKGWAHAIAHGADAIGALAESPHLAGREHAVLLDVLAERLLQQPAGQPLESGEPDRMAHAVMRILRRNTLGTDVLEPWVHRIGAAANAFGGPATTTRSPAPTRPRRSCARSSSSSPWRPTRRRCAPTCCSC